jgi:DNA-binding CsgD family transcriptional regulator
VEIREVSALRARGRGGRRHRPRSADAGVPLLIDGEKRWWRMDEDGEDEVDGAFCPQQILVRNLILVFLRDGGDLRFEAGDVAVEGIDTDHPSGPLPDGDGTKALGCDLVAGADGPARLELAHALADLGQQQLRGGDRSTARATIRRAAELALECRAQALADRLTAGLTTKGGRPPRLRLTGVSALTPSERRVAQLAADALTNRQIAERLYVTEKTVEAHLSRAFRKLDVRSGIQLVSRLGTGPRS